MSTGQGGGGKALQAFPPTPPSPPTCLNEQWSGGRREGVTSLPPHPSLPPTCLHEQWSGGRREGGHTLPPRPSHHFPPKPQGPMLRHGLCVSCLAAVAQWCLRRTRHPSTRVRFPGAPSLSLGRNEQWSGGKREGRNSLPPHPSLSWVLGLEGMPACRYHRPKREGSISSGQGGGGKAVAIADNACCHRRQRASTDQHEALTLIPS